MKMNGWAAAAIAALSVAGCATGVQGTAGTPVPAGGQMAASPATGSYRIVRATDRNHLGSATVVFLVRKGDRWAVGFDPDEFQRGDGERLAYWPEEKKVAFVFDSSQPTSDAAEMCEDKKRDRKKHGYTVCSSAFRVADNSGSSIFARTLVGVATGGASEVIYAGKGARFERIDSDEVRAVLERLDFHRQVWLRDYRQRAAVATVSGQRDFIGRYEHDDPEQLVPKARDMLGTLAANARILETAERSTPAAAQYRARFMPAAPQKYCNQLKSNSEDFRYCQATVARAVADLAEKHASAARRADVCQAVVKAVGGGVQPGACQQYSTGTCYANTPKGQQVCAILNRKGQS